MPRHPTITLKEKPKVVVLKGRAKGPTVVLTPLTIVDRELYGFTWKGVLQVRADNSPMLFTTHEKAKENNSARCKIVRLKLMLLP